MADFLTIRHQIRDFDAWKDCYDADAPNRKAAGLTDLLCLRGAEDPNLVGIVFGVGDPAKARAFVQSSALRETTRNAGLVGAVAITFRRGEFKPAATADYVTLTAQISGLHTFLQGYAMDVADRQAATMTDLGVLQNVEDLTDLLLVWSAVDVARAKAFLGSPDLAVHQVANAGLIGPSEARFWTAA